MFINSQFLVDHHLDWEDSEVRRLEAMAVRHSGDLEVRHSGDLVQVLVDTGAGLDIADIIIADFSAKLFFVI